MKKLCCPDTNIFLDRVEALQGYNVVVLSHVLRELENHKKQRSDLELAYKARKATRYIKANKNKFKFDSKSYDGSLLGEGYNNRYEDYNITLACLENNYLILTDDVLLSYLAEGFGIEVAYIDNDDENSDSEYKGYVETYMLPDQINEVYQNLEDNKWDLLQNQYLIIKDDITGQEIEAFRWDGKFLISVHEKGFGTLGLGKFKPKDIYQQCALNSLSSNQVTQIKGRSGTGKSLIAVSYAWNQIERGKFQKLVIFSNPVNAGKSSSKLGFYKGNKDEKLMDGNLGGILASKFGDKAQVEALILADKINLYPFSDIRGIDVQDSIVWIVEAENLDKELLKIAIQRISESSKLIVDGDYNQVDADIFEGSRNGMKRMTEVFKGKEMYGEIELHNVYRSRIAEIAEEM